MLGCDWEPLTKEFINDSSFDNSFSWTDITNDFFDAISFLRLGELFHDELFGLFEAMSAIEMMDPKMDAGMLCNRGGKPTLNFEQALVEGRIKLDGLTLNEQIIIVDRTMSCFVSWLEGHSLAQTVFTNLYMQKPHLIECRPLKSFCICMYKIIDIIRDFVSRGMVFEEEDFQLGMYGYRLSPDVSDQRTVGMLREVESELNEVIHSSSSATILEVEWATALNSRIRFVRLFYQLFLALKKDSLQAGGGIGECYNLLTTCSEMIPSLIKTTCTYETDHACTNWSDYGFDAMINQRLLPPTFPRYTKIKNNVDSFHYFESLLIRLKQVLRITTNVSFQDALHYFIEISRTNPCIVSRSVMQILYMPENGKVLGSTNIIDVLRDTARTFICPPVLSVRSLIANKEEAKENVDAFFNRCIRPFTLFIQLCGHNRARQRDKLSHLLEDYAALQDEAERVDVYLHNISIKMEPPRSHLACFGTWILYYVLKIMIMYLLSGFELELYSAHEYTYIFWYLNEFLYGWLISALTRAENISLNQELANENLKHRSGVNKRNKTKKKKNRSNSCEIIMCQALQNICGGFYKAIIGFQLEDKIKSPYFEFDNEKVRYEHRFLAFNVLMTPPLVQYSEFYENNIRLKETGVDTLYSAATKLFHQARTVLESIPNPDQEIHSLLKVAKTNFVVLKVLASGHKRGSEHTVDFDFSAHHHFPIFRLN
ncbi:hypothetical protein V9T40_000276 [Parthenolecanium corni]|uniref:Protein MAK10 homolog n=1 Tax=Parthenolecanium corni TaxID=536013 RepID=A0AAN9T983_9HEMI